MNPTTQAKNARSAQLPRTSPKQRAAARKLAPTLSALLRHPTLRKLSYTDAKAALFTAYERLRITQALDEHDGNIAAAAESLGIHRQSLQHILRKHGMPATNRRRR